MATKRAEFTDKQKAEIFARDRALCSYSGISLWLADHGAAPSSIDWVDHFKAAASGGAATLENGLCASYAYNWARRDGRPSIVLYFHGRPTLEYYNLFGAVRPEVDEHLLRFSRLHPSDWYANRTLFQILKGARGIKATRNDGSKLTRDIPYYAKAAVGFRQAWLQNSSGVASLSRRGLLPKRPQRDQSILLSALDATTITDMGAVIRELAPWCESCNEALSWPAYVRTVDSADECRYFLKDWECLPSRIRRQVQTNLDSLRLTK